MKDHPSSIQPLNQNLKLELTAINQFFLHSRIAQNWGLENLAKASYQASIGAMKTADSLIARILFLEGLPNLQALGKILVGEDVAEIVSCDLSLMTQSRTQYQRSIKLCEQSTDYESRSLLIPALNQVEEHIDRLETQSWLIDSLGIENYIQSQTGG